MAYIVPGGNTDFHRIKMIDTDSGKEYILCAPFHKGEFRHATTTDDEATSLYFYHADGHKIDQLTFRELTEGLSTGNITIM